MLILSFLPFIISIATTESTPTKPIPSSFYVIPLGTTGGLEENNLSAYLITSTTDNTPNSAYISLDGGTIRHGLQIAVQKNSLSSNTDVETFFREQIKAYLISHAHLDHNSGFLLNTPNDKSGKFIIGLNETITIIQDHYFNNQAWADFGPTGLKTYDYQILNPSSAVSDPIANTDLNVRIFRLCHTCPYLSSAFLISRRDQSNASVLYLGDTGPDDVEKIVQPDNTTSFPRYLDKMWKDITPLVVADQLKAIFIEVSYPSERPDNLLFGHLTPKWLLEELKRLNSYHSIEKVKIIVTHIKPEKGAREKIIEQLKNNNDQHFNFIFPQQGEAIWL
ncbi:unnamed protein product [Adineta steineri]|uniref:3',5'-cyclic-nucleotide phosphodiesterase n=1 Tax=Adineta steineri TaxID=433720 RepID=A0A818RBT8_9BILA|nr:unnamed protein product [Adineta steineri]CAF1185104.1 unnamed protein product [Adineta steineri]CAF3648067.1 unnamed protein product [Adineta steineri]CAF4086241.1 unnamed protein product [Adineta steineri]